MGGGSFFFTTSVTLLHCCGCAGFLAAPGIHKVNFSFKRLHNLFPLFSWDLSWLPLTSFPSLFHCQLLREPFLAFPDKYPYIPMPTPHPVFLSVSCPIACFLFASGSFFHLNDPFPKQDSVLFN